VRGVESRPRRCLFQALVLAVAVAAPAGAAGPDRALWPQVLIEDAFTRSALLWALEDAAERLAQPKCQAVLSDFAAQDGRPLHEKLEPTGATPADYLRHVWFRDGSGVGKCQATPVLAFTVPGSPVVFVCGRRFQDLWRRDPRAAEAVVIHEALHTLGLGENPPSSLQITLQVRKRCLP
jgi:hypothetical protein